MENLELKKSFLTSMRGITSTVCVISAKMNDAKHAMTATSAVSISIDPPTMLVSVNKEASIHSLMNKNSFFCINVLSQSQQDLAEVCSNSEEGESRFSNNSWKIKDSFIYNEQSMSNLFCECTDTLDQSTHTIFIGTVLDVNNNPNQKPLLYGSGKYQN